MSQSASEQEHSYITHNRRWIVVPAKAPKQWREYKDFDEAVNALIAIAIRKNNKKLPAHLHYLQTPLAKYHLAKQYNKPINVGSPKKAKPYYILPAGVPWGVLVSTRR